MTNDNTPRPIANPSMVDQIMRYESGQMPYREMIDFFQHLVNTGDVWSLQGHYGRTAQSLIRSGLVTAL